MDPWHWILEEKWHPAGYASRALQPFEQRYAQTEKEVLSVVFGTERFHEYFYGRHFIVSNDSILWKLYFNALGCPIDGGLEKCSKPN